ncbi:DUF2800 domain-containing protein [Bradyrhizobium stylosanthis]|uniref:Uncharacterized protein DUF2800 n=1 Tax=Bradyrhizobium stylosanthis TaxID=1803665 RepID=A0A560CXG0_9BRAD|nr:DUF2800 domain-containing protein [Bradyrhizobium stylosanthis]TWA89543.1 uncharacterized protein DUF2800 [Bradyrhizobium stylosanthis]
MAKKPQAHGDRAHARLSPSAAYRWFACAGSPVLESAFENKSSKFADHGTAAHTLGEYCIANDCDAADFAGGHVNIKTGKVHKAAGEGNGIFEVDDEMVEGVQLYVDTVRSFIAPGDDVEIECKLDLTHIEGMEFGTGDFLRYRGSEKHLVICDLKYGKGVPVEVKRNEQLLTYADGTAKRFHNRGLDKITMVIVQPRCPPPKEDSDVVWLNPEGTARSWTIDVLDLAEFRFDLTEAAAKTREAECWAGAADFHARFTVAGDHCKFCRAATTCPTLKRFALAEAELEFGDTPPSVSELEAETIATVLAKAGTLKDWIKRVEERAHALALEGSPPPHWKLVHSTSHRKFRDEVSAEFLHDVTGITVEELLTEPKLRSPAQVEKLLGAKRKKEIEGLVYKPKGKIILAPEDDPRPAVKPDAESEFA